MCNRTMKPTGVIFDLRRYTVHDGPGIRTTVFFKGCPLRCRWCHNPESMNPAIETLLTINHRRCPAPSAAENRGTIGREVSVDEVLREIEKDTIFYDQSGGGATFSGGEPLMQADFLLALLSACAEREIHRALDTCGYASWATFEKILPRVNLILYDLKLMDDAEHLRYTGVSNTPILNNLEKLAETGVPIFLRIPLIPGVTDTEKNLEQIAGFIRPLKNIQRVDPLPYNLLSEDKNQRFGFPNRLEHLEVQSAEELSRVEDRFVSMGYNVKIGG